MNPTGKAGKPRNRPPQLQGETQFQRFIETAKALDADDGGVQFMQAMDVLARQTTVAAKKNGVANRQPQDLTENSKKRTIVVRASKSGSTG